MARVLLALLLGFAGAADAREPEPLASLAQCAGRLDPKLDVGYERIAMRCPDLSAALERSPWAAWLPADWKEPHNQLSAAGLRVLHDALARESAAAAGTRGLRPERVGEVLARVTRTEPEHEGWWARFKRWLHALLAPQPQEDSGWLRRLLGDVSIDRAMLRLVTALAIAVLVVLAVVVVVNELRVAGLLRRRPRLARQSEAGSGARGGPGLTDLDHAEPRAQPALLLELIAARLAAQDRLPPARAFTVHELTRRARLRDEAERARLAALAAVSERVRYAADTVPAPALADALRGGRELLAALAAPAAAGA